MTNIIAKFSGDHRFLSNFYEAPVDIGGKTFPTNEHAFQACKSKVIKIDDNLLAQAKVAYIEGILKCKTPQEAKTLGGQVSIEVGAWAAMKVPLMRDVVFAKFSQHDDLRKKLMNTGHAMLVEGNTWNDTFWGRCDGRGYNILGVILMEIRGYYLWRRETDFVSRDLRTPSGESLHPIN